MDAELSGKRILLVDDDEDTLTTYKIWLESNGFLVSTYSSPFKVLSEFKPDNYDLLLVDIRMPEMTGFELCQELRALDPNFKICFITSFELYYTNLKESYPKLKDCCFVQKPASMEKLLALVVRNIRTANGHL